MDAHTPITTPTQASDEQQLSSVIIAVMGVVIAIFGLLAVRVIVIIVINPLITKLSY